jgi:hypothetical protein
MPHDVMRRIVAMLVEPSRATEGATQFRWLARAAQASRYLRQVATATGYLSSPAVVAATAAASRKQACTSRMISIRSHDLL